jgi:hypothetical protein
MRNRRHSKIHTFLFIFLSIALAVLASTATLQRSRAASPSNGTLTLASGRWSIPGAICGANVSAQANGTPICNAALPCDDFALTINVPAGTDATKQVKVAVGWPVSSADFDVYILQGSTVVATAASSSDPEIVFLPAVSAAYTIRVVPFIPAVKATPAQFHCRTFPPRPVGQRNRTQISELSRAEQFGGRRLGG